MRAVGLLLIAPILAVEVSAAEKPKLPEPYRSIAELSHAAPPEFSSDALLRIVETNNPDARKIDRDNRRDLVEQAFRLAASAKFPIRMHGVAGSLGDTRSGLLSNAYDLKLDSLSLQSRAVRDMLPIDAARAREMFLGIPRPAIAPLTCQDPMVYDVSDYYLTVAAIFHGAFTAQERKKEEDLSFLLDDLGQVASPAQLAPAARLIKSAGVSAQQQEILWNKFNGLLESMRADDRSFVAALGEIAREITPASQASFDKYKQLSKGCPDDARPGVTLDMSQGPVHAGSTPQIERYWESGPAKQLLEAGQRLRYTADGKVLPDAARSTREWQQQLTDYLNQLADWTAAQEKSEADYYHEKCIVYEALVELIPPGAQRDKMVQAYVDFVGNSSLQQQSPVEWFMHAHSMLERVRNTANGEPAKLLEAFERSGNPVLALYAAEEKIFTGQVPSWVINSN